MLGQVMSNPETSAQVWMIAPDADAPEHVCISSWIFFLRFGRIVSQLKLPLQGSACKPDDSARDSVPRCAGCQAESSPKLGSPGHHWGHEGQEQAGLVSSLLPCNYKEASTSIAGCIACHCSYHSLQTLRCKELLHV